MNPTLKRTSLPLLAGALTALVLPWSSATAGTAAEFSGHNLSAWAAPVKMEFYEPTIPIPADPQFELELAYSTVEAETGLARGRGSWFWPGDSVGEGAKTFADAFGLPEEVGKQGYPVQVNSVWPTGPVEERQEPFPGTVMRTSAAEAGVGAQVGWSPDNRVQEPGSGGEGEGGEGEGDGGAPGLPGLPTGTLADFGAAITGTADTRAAAAPEEEPAEEGAPGLPPELAALVDFAAYTSSSSATTGDDEVSAYARSSLADVSLIGGLVTLEGLRTRTVTTSDGARATADGRAALGALAISGNEFTVGPEGVEAAGQQGPIPGLPDDAKQALAQLGLSFELPEPLLETDGDFARSRVEGLVVVIDMVRLREQIKDVPLGQIVDAIPNDAGQLKSAIQAAANLSPRIVITLGNAVTSTDTVAPIGPLPVPPDPDDGDGDDGTDGTGGTGGNGGGVPTGTGGTATPDAPVDAGDGDTTGELADAAPMGSGLPPLNSIPGALTLGGIVLATAAGTWLRKIGAIALGGAGTCPHGLDSGLPDLRKA